MKATWLTVSELAAAMKLSAVSIRRACWKGEIPVVRIGRMVRFDLEQVRKAVQQTGHGSSASVRNGAGAVRRALHGQESCRRIHKDTSPGG
jgi:excisionase family DNA binding protein